MIETALCKPATVLCAQCDLRGTSLIKELCPKEAFDPPLEAGLTLSSAIGIC